jgi:ribosomal protein L11 methyltransferase
MPYLQLTFDIAARDAEAAEVACLEGGALSVTLLDAADAPILEPAPGETPLWPKVRFAALFAEDVDRDGVDRVLEAALGGPLTNPEWRVIEDRVWEREWLKDFGPMRFGARLWVCPHGQTPPEPDAIVVWLDPGLAFGTGTHTTTAMCLAWLDSIELHALDVVDYGCGSGVLAIAALKLGARHADAIDLDPQALIATRDNALRNGVSTAIDVRSTGDPAPLGDVLIANILAEPLIALARTLASLVRRPGLVALSGILGSQAEAVARAFTPWFDMRPFAAHDGWVCLEGVRR